MKTVAVAMTASLSLLIAGCALDTSVDGSAAHPAAAQQNGAERPARLTVAAAPSAAGDADESAGAAGGAPERGVVGAPATRNTGDETVRDAKEATEEAARKIFDAAVGAATKIKEVGRGAVQAVRDANARDKAAHGEHANLDDDLVAAEDASAVGAVD
jgi:hypothetical protein